MNILTIHTPFQIELASRNKLALGDPRLVIYRPKSQASHQIRTALNSSNFTDIVWIEDRLQILWFVIIATFFAKNVIIGNYNSGLYKLLSITRLGNLSILDEGSNIYLLPKRTKNVGSLGVIFTISKTMAKRYNNFRLLQLSKFSQVTFPEKTSVIEKVFSHRYVVLGSADVEENIVSMDYYLSLISKLPSRAIYLSHRRETPAKLELVSQHIDVLHSPVSIEYLYSQLEKFSDFQGTFISFGSTAEITLATINPKVNINRVSYDANEVQQSYLNEYEIIISGLTSDYENIRNS